MNWDRGHLDSSYSHESQWQLTNEFEWHSFFRGFTFETKTEERKKKMCRRTPPLTHTHTKYSKLSQIFSLVTCHFRVNAYSMSKQHFSAFSKSQRIGIEEWEWKLELKIKTKTRASDAKAYNNHPPYTQWYAVLCRRRVLIARVPHSLVANLCSFGCACRPLNGILFETRNSSFFFCSIIFRSLLFYYYLLCPCRYGWMNTCTDTHTLNVVHVFAPLFRTLLIQLDSTTTVDVNFWYVHHSSLLTFFFFPSLSLVGFFVSSINLSIYLCSLRFGSSRSTYGGCTSSFLSGWNNFAWMTFHKSIGYTAPLCVESNYASRVDAWCHQFLHIFKFCCCPLPSLPLDTPNGIRYICFYGSVCGLDANIWCKRMKSRKKNQTHQCLYPFSFCSLLPLSFVRLAAAAFYLFARRTINF